MLAKDERTSRGKQRKTGNTFPAIILEPRGLLTA